MAGNAENEGGALRIHSTLRSFAVVGSRPLMLATLLGASIGVPYVVSQSKDGSPAATSPGVTPPTAVHSTAWPTWGPSTTPAPATTPPPPSLLPSTAAQPITSTAAYPSTATPAALASFGSVPPTGVRYHTIQEVLRFNVTKEWVYQNWDRKSTGLGDPQLFGIRVALVTGTQRSDLAGSLTYLFDAQGQVQHISFRGRTADTTPLVQFLTQTYQFQQMEAPAGEQLYQVRSGSDVYSELRTRPESVLLESTPQGSIGVVLELGRPGSNRALVPDVPKLDIPPASTPPPSTETAKAATGEAGEEQPGMVGKFRPATQSEHNQVFEHRWPN